jgi:predicted SnoaL-like aldol condensation-catalyzing enzyme
MSDSIYAMANGTAVDSVLDRTLKNANSAKVMKAEAFKMKEAGKITEAEYNKIKDYKSKSDYQKDNNNKTIHENGNITKGPEKKAPPKLKGKGPSRGQQRLKSGGGSSGGNTGSGSKKDKKIICDYFYRKGLLSKELWKADEAYGKELSRIEPDVMKGYHAWAIHYVHEMEKESLLGKLYFVWAKLWVPHWAKYLAGEKTIRGKILHSIGKPICNLIGLLLTHKEKRAWQ